MKKIGILIISNGWSGAENSVYHLMNRLNNNYYLLLNREMVKYYKNIKNIVDLGNFYNTNKIIQLRNYIYIRKKLKEAIRKYDLSVIVLFLVDSFVLAYKQKVVIIPSLRGTEVVDYLSNSNSPKKLILKSIFNTIFENSSKIVSVSREQIKGFPKKYINKLIVIPNGVNSEMFRPIRSIKSNKKVILFAGKFVDIKGIREIINVAKELPQYEFWFAGKGNLENLIKLPNTRNLGFKSAEELIKLYNKSNICIQPSYREGFSNIGLEITSCGKALICTPPFSEYIENGKDGIIIPAKDEKALKDAIVDLMTNDKKRKMIEKNARKKALQYSWDNVAKRYMEVFKEVLKESEKKK